MNRYLTEEKLWEIIAQDDFYSVENEHNFSSTERENDESVKSYSYSF